MKRHSTKSYRTILSRTRSSLSYGEKLFSRIIHNKVVVRIADSLENTIFRTTPLYFGVLAAITTGTVMLMVAILFNYAITSFYSLGLIFILGYGIGYIYEYMQTSWKQK